VLGPGEMIVVTTTSRISRKNSVIGLFSARAFNRRHHVFAAEPAFELKGIADLPLPPEKSEPPLLSLMNQQPIDEDLPPRDEPA
jgi:hypothetical protein